MNSVQNRVEHWITAKSRLLIIWTTDNVWAKPPVTEAGGIQPVTLVGGESHTCRGIVDAVVIEILE